MEITARRGSGGILHRQGNIVARLMASEHLEAAHTLAASTFGAEEGRLARENFTTYLRHHAGNSRGEFNGRRLQYIVLEDHGHLEEGRPRVVGFSGLYTMPTESTADVKRGGVRPKFRLGWTALDETEKGKGLGKLMVEVMERHAKGSGASHLLIETSNLHLPAMGLYEKRGFVRGYSRVPDYFTSGRKLYTAYRNLSELKPNAPGGFNLRELTREDFARLGSKIRELSGTRFEELKRTSKFSLSHPDDELVRTRFHGLFDEKGRLRGVADVSEHSWDYDHVAFTSFLHGDTPEAKRALLEHLGKHIMDDRNRSLHVVHGEKRDWSFLQQNKFSEAQPKVTGFYQPEEHGELYVKRLIRR